MSSPLHRHHMPGLHSLPPVLTLSHPTSLILAAAGRSGRLLPLLVLLPVTIVLALALRPVASPSSNGGTQPAARSVSPQVSYTPGTVIQVRFQTKSASVVLRSASGKLVQLTLGIGHQAITRDGHPLAATSIRLGDSLIPGAGQVVDRSQRWLEVSGTVAGAPFSDGDPMLVQLGPAQTIVVDIGPESQVSEGAEQGIARSTIEDADRVHLSGALDEALGEMTQTAAIVRLGP